MPFDQIKSLLEDDTQIPSGIVPPPVFSVTDFPIYLRSHKNDADSIEEHPVSAKNINSSKPREKKPYYIVKFEENLPESGPIEAIEEMHKKVPKEIQEIYSKLFQERPLWTKIAASQRLLSSNTSQEAVSHMKICFQAFSFFYIDGPFKDAWCKYGFNVKSLDNISACIPCHTVRCLHPQVRSRSSLNETSRKLRFSTSLASVGTTSHDKVSALLLKQQNAEFDGKFSDDLDAAFVQYQFGDLVEPFCYAIVHDISNLRNENCSPTEGWFIDGTLNKLRWRIKNKWRIAVGLTPFDESKAIPLSNNYSRRTAKHSKITTAMIAGSENISPIPTAAKEDEYSTFKDVFDSFLKSVDDDEGSSTSDFLMKMNLLGTEHTNAAITNPTGMDYFELLDDEFDYEEEEDIDPNENIA